MWVNILLPLESGASQITDWGYDIWLRLACYENSLQNVSGLPWCTSASRHSCLRSTSGMQTFQFLQRASTVEALVLCAQLNGDHVVFSSIMQTEISHTGQCMENMVGMVAQQYCVSPSPAEQRWADMLVFCHGSTSRNELPTCVAEPTRLFVIHNVALIFIFHYSC